MGGVQYAQGCVCVCLCACVCGAANGSHLNEGGPIKQQASACDGGVNEKAQVLGAI